MLYDRYDVIFAPGATTFEFDSIGPKGIVRKVVFYAEVGERFYNLGFGDKDPLTGLINDLEVTNNNDGKKVLATVASTLYLFTDVHPKAIVTAVGNTEARTRLYRMGIANSLKDIERDFIVYGLAKNGWELFVKNIDYRAFLVHRKL